MRAARRLTTLYVAANTVWAAVWAVDAWRQIQFRIEHAEVQRKAAIERAQKAAAKV